MRGRKPTPTALKLVAGERSDRVNDDEPQPGEGIPVCPSSHPQVRKVWDYTVDQLQRMRVITMADRDALAAYCEAVVQHRVASEILAREGLIVEGSHGGSVPHPAQKIQREAAAMLRAYSTEFGLTPSARSRIKVGDSQPEKTQGAGRLLSS